MKKGLILTVLLTGVSALGFSQTAFAVRGTATWIEAVNGIRGGGNDQEYAITVTGTVSVPAAHGGENTFGQITGIKVTITGSGALSPSNNGSLLVVGAGQTVVVKDLTLRGRDNNTKAVIFIDKQGAFHMEGNASVTGNTDSGSGGVYINGGTLIMQDCASVSGNTSSEYGGGIYLNGGTFTMQNNAQVSGNAAKGSNSGGGGIFINGGAFTMQGGAVKENTAGRGGGVFLNNGAFAMQGGSISSNTAASNLDNSGGGGVFVNAKNAFNMEGGAISGNTASCKYGGGVFVAQEGTFNMQGDASVSGNKAAYSGGGVYNRGNFVIKDSASVSGNTVSNGGGGVHSWGTFTMQDSSRVSGNNSNWGGGVLVNRGTFTMQGGASVSGNIGANGGGGVYVHEGTFVMQGAASISGNTSYLGGAVYIAPNGTFSKTGGTVSGADAEQSLRNTAVSGKGFAFYEDKSKSWRNAGAGLTTNPGSYGFWLNEEAAATGFPPDFIGVWERNNFNNKLAITAATVKSSSRDVTWKFASASGDTYTLEANTANKTKLTLNVKYVEGDGFFRRNHLKISGDSGNGENNWNGEWYKH